MSQVVLHVEGMTCSNCAAAVQRALASLDGVRHVDVRLLEKRVTVDYEPERTDPASIRARVDDAGYEANIA